MKWNKIGIILGAFLFMNAICGYSDYSKIEVDVEIKEYYGEDYVDKVGNTYYTYPNEENREHKLKLVIKLNNKNEDTITINSLEFIAKIESSQGEEIGSFNKSFGTFLLNPQYTSLNMEIDHYNFNDGIKEDLINKTYRFYVEVKTSRGEEDKIEAQSDIIYLKIISKEEYDQEFSGAQKAKKAISTGWSITKILGVIFGIILFFAAVVGYARHKKWI